MASGIIDPAKVVRCALENAASVAKVRENREESRLRFAVVCGGVWVVVGAAPWRTPPPWPRREPPRRATQSLAGPVEVGGALRPADVSAYADISHTSSLSPLQHEPPLFLLLSQHRPS